MSDQVNDEYEDREKGAEVEVETDADDSVDSDDDQDSNFRKAESSTQKRIDRLTKKMREAERREQEALRYARQVQAEADSLKKRVSTLDTGYVAEYSNRIKTEMAQAEAELARAIELGNSQKTVEAQRKLTALAIQQDRANQAVAQQQRQRQAAQNAPRPVQQPQQPQQPARRPDPKVEAWVLRNKHWFSKDKAMTYAAFGIHSQLVEEEGFDPKSDEYYTELDRRLESRFGEAVKPASKRAAQTVAGANRTYTSGRSGKKVRLTPSQVAIATKLGVPLDKYAKYVTD